MYTRFLFLVVFACACFLTFVGRGQQFKWVRGGGTIQDFSSLPSRENEQVKFMCTDPNGNVYALSQVGNNPIVADTFHGLAYGANENILLTSYNCSGQMRWAKLIASSGGPSWGLGVVADSLGHIYVAGEMPGGTLHIGYDTTIPGAVYDLSGLIQFDTSGHFKWIRYVGNNTPASYAATSTLFAALAVDGANNAHFIPYIGSGAVLAASVTSQYGNYDLTYSPSGTLMSAVRLGFDSVWSVRGAVIDPVTNKLYAYGEINQYIYGGFLTDTFFAAAFDASRNLLWQYFAGHGDDAGFSGIAFDQGKHLYFSGAASPLFGETRFVFNGDSVLAPYDVLSIIMKTDTNGTVEWIRSNGCHTSVNGFQGLTLLPNNQIACVGTIAGTLS